MPDNWLQILQSVQGGIFLLALVLGSQGVWVYGWVYRDKCRECNNWKRAALRSTDLAEIAEDSPRRRDD